MSRNIVELYTLELDGDVVLVGSDLDTRQIGFYTEKDGIISPADEATCQQAAKMISQLSEVPSPEFRTILEDSINACRNYNNKKGYSNSNLERNARQLSLSCSKSDLAQSNASYDIFNNAFTFDLPEQCWNLSGISGLLMHRRSINQIISHEVGHMSVSDMQIRDNNLVGNIGFLQMTVPIEMSTQTSDGNNYYRIDKSQEIKENGARGLEELFNELENDARVNSSLSPNFAHRLDTITNGKLRLARQNHSLTDYYMTMQNIILSKDKSMLLLMGIDAYYSSIRQQEQNFASKLENEINRVLTDYEIAKTSSKSSSTYQPTIGDNLGDDSDAR